MSYLDLPPPGGVARHARASPRRWARRWRRASRTACASLQADSAAQCLRLLHPLSAIHAACAAAATNALVRSAPRTRNRTLCTRGCTCT